MALVGADRVNVLQDDEVWDERPCKVRLQTPRDVGCQLWNVNPLSVAMLASCRICVRRR